MLYEYKLREFIYCDRSRLYFTNCFLIALFHVELSYM